MKIKIHFKLMWLFNAFKFLLIVGISSFFWWRIYPLLNPRLKTPADFANNIIETEILCVWRERVDEVEIKTLRNIKITGWTNRKEETDSRPFETASGRVPYEGCCAVSRDLFGWLINFGDRIFIEETGESLVVECKLADKLKDGTPIKRTIDKYYDKSRLEEAKNFRILDATIQVTIPRERNKER